MQQYHSLYPLEDLSLTREKSSQAFGMKTTLMKGVSSRDGRAYTLRRLDNRRVRLFYNFEMLAACNTSLCTILRHEPVAWTRLQKTFCR